MFNRIEIVLKIKDFLVSHKDVIAAWEGGSVATGYNDDISDLDVMIVTQDNNVEQIFIELEGFLTKQFGIKRKFRIPEPAWHGFSQCFYEIDKAPELFYLDISVLKRTLEQKMTERDRHGKASIWVDKELLINTNPTQEKSILEKGRQYYHIATGADFITRLEIRKAIKRKNFLEAMPLYYNFISRNITYLLNLKHRPNKVDFGMRYIYRDYSKQDSSLIENSLKVNNIEELEDKFNTLEKTFFVLIEELKEKWQ
jgi:predicted nucleotidyltransferase